MVFGGVLVYVVDHQLAPATDKVTVPPIERLMQGEPPAAGSPARLPPAAEPTAALPLPDPALHVPMAASLSASESAAVATSMNGEQEAGAEAAQRAAQRAAERKDRAWADYYKKPAMCDEYATRAIMVECANQYIRARSQFEESYGEGKR